MLEFTRQLAMQHQQLTEDKRHLELSNQIPETSNKTLEQENKYLDALNQQYKHEIDLFKRHKFAQKNEHLTAKQISLLDEAVEEDIAAVDLELEQRNADKSDASTHKPTVNKPKLRPMPDHLAICINNAFWSNFSSNYRH
jgi:hypothetical protein